MLDDRKSVDEEVVLKHPYQAEIENFMHPEYSMKSAAPIASQPFDDNAGFKWIDSFEDLQNLSVLFEKQSCFAVDLEHHNYRSFQGFVCLMQISTRDSDFVIDTLELREHLHVLNASFTDPNITKVSEMAEEDDDSFLNRFFMGLKVT